ncbi:glucose-specific PTS transporter subunit IIBC [Clostridium gasigenes]|uniref:PTS system, D-glucosamine-specific IIC component n=1 Tax=Clostridium gasigenes TaxID=94869 RepID=A0A1H0RYF5_9CLOT|nr:glucose-specific PTS transporter subunit IIBC [Clostridium gasigenes]MBB6622646.1 PTS transporter subunit EIIC [Clostridium gasigenes]MBU3088578.1 glucose-specific PTS transporter subunit IIBC [Clostridium gasigenes]SDP34359.1 PTS system, D-glucosamine-specific IIC component [Clostridium gasigenes]
MRELLKGSFGVLQRIGKALMLPVALLPAAGLLLGIGTMLQSLYFLDLFPAVGIDWIQSIALIMSGSGNIIFTNLPLIFAVGVAIGLCDGDGVAGLATIVGFLIMNVSMGIGAGVTADMVTGNPMYTMILGIPTLQTGVFGGIIIGIVASIVYRKFYNIELPQFLGFFSGKRFIPIVTAVAGLIVGLALVIIWPPIQNGLLIFSRGMIDTNQTVAALIFGIIERSLIPFGLHHIWYNPFWYQFGEYTNQAGQLIIGDQAIFMAQLKDGVEFTAGTFMTGKYPFMMFGLPAAALAMYHEAREDKKKLVAGIFFSAALTSFLTGITEPIEFTFLFVAPVLFGVHCIFAGISFMTMQILNVKIGLTFSGGIIDYLLFGVFPNRTAWWLVIPVGVIFAIIYYFGFRFIIRKLDLKTPGRENDEIEVDIDVDNGELAVKVLEALGGKSNIKHLDACITRLRVIVLDLSKVDKNEFKVLGSAGTMQIGKNIQIIFGPKSDRLKEQIKGVISGKEIEKKLIKTIEEIKPGIDTGVKIAIPVSGKLINLEEVPDDVFSMRLIGDGFAIDPTEGSLLSPVKGKITALIRTNHAITITTDTGMKVFIHIGIDTIKLNGDGFVSFIKVGDEVNIGDKLIEFPLESIKANKLSPIIPIIFKNISLNEYVYYKRSNKVRAKDSNKIEIHMK